MSPPRPKFHSLTSLTGCTFLVACLLLAWPSSASADFNLNFATNPTLPSAQGLSYDGSVSETSAFSIINNSTINQSVLHLDTPASAFYQEPNGGYNGSADATMIATLKVYSTLPVDFAFFNSSSGELFEISSTGWSVYGGASGTFANPNAFQTVEMQTFAATNTYAFSVNGVVVATGTRYPGFGGGPQVYFGDGLSSQSGDMIADFASVTYYQGPVNPYAVPEPSGLMTMAMSIPIFFVVLRLRTRWCLQPIAQ